MGPASSKTGGFLRDRRSELWTSAPHVMAMDPAQGVLLLPCPSRDAKPRVVGLGWETSEEQPMPGSCRASRGQAKASGKLLPRQ